MSVWCFSDSWERHLKLFFGQKTGHNSLIITEEKLERERERKGLGEDEQGGGEDGMDRWDMIQKTQVREMLSW